MHSVKTMDSVKATVIWISTQLRGLNCISEEDKQMYLFEEELGKYINRQLECTNSVSIKMNSYKASFLYHFVEGSMIHSLKFPYQTTMWITENKVTVREGIYSPVQTIFQKY